VRLCVLPAHRVVSAARLVWAVLSVVLEISRGWRPGGRGAGAPAGLACRRNSPGVRLARPPIPPRGAALPGVGALAARSPHAGLERRRRLVPTARPHLTRPASALAAFQHLAFPSVYLACPSLHLCRAALNPCRSSLDLGRSYLNRSRPSLSLSRSALR